MNPTLLILIGGWIIVLIWLPLVISLNRKTHPRALFVLFFAEMWERFSYYGMRALLTLYMTKVLFFGEPDAESTALSIYGAYTAMVYLFPLIGGLIADRIFGFRKAIMFGGVLMMLGHFTLALEGLALDGSMPLFFMALALIIIGNGYFKPNISSLLGRFYDQDDPRKDGAFTIFYMGINIGAFLATVTCGYVGEEINWHYGFGLAGIGMALGLVAFGFNRAHLGDKGDPPANRPGHRPVIGRITLNWVVYAGTALMLPIVALMLNVNEVVSGLLLVASIGILAYLVWEGWRTTDRVSGERLWVVGVLFVFHAVFWALFEQAGGSLTLFTDKNVDRVVAGAEIPASVFQSLNPFYIIFLAPVFSALWIRLRALGAEPSTPMKFVLGLTQLALGFAVIVVAAEYFATNGLVPIVFLALMYLLHTTGEMTLSPIGLSMVTKLSPARIVGFVMGAWFLSIALANNMAGLIGSLTASDRAPQDVTPIESLPLYSGTYLIWGVVVVLGAAFVLLLLTPLLRRWMNGIR